MEPHSLAKEKQSSSEVIRVEHRHGEICLFPETSRQKAIEQSQYSFDSGESFVVGILVGNEVWVPCCHDPSVAMMQQSLQRLAERKLSAKKLRWTKSYPTVEVDPMNLVFGGTYPSFIDSEGDEDE